MRTTHRRVIKWALIEIAEVVVYADPERIKKAAKLHRP
jgi:hypothetical protein